VVDVAFTTYYHVATNFAADAFYMFIKSTFDPY